jgi:hypothetical protein
MAEHTINLTTSFLPPDDFEDYGEEGASNRAPEVVLVPQGHQKGHCTWRWKTFRLTILNSPQAHTALMRCTDSAPCWRCFRCEHYISCRKSNITRIRHVLCLEGDTPSLTSRSITSFNFGMDVRLIAGTCLTELGMLEYDETKDRMVAVSDSHGICAPQKPLSTTAAHFALGRSYSYCSVLFWNTPISVSWMMYPL